MSIDEKLKVEGVQVIKKYTRFVVEEESTSARAASNDKRGSEITVALEASEIVE